MSESTAGEASSRYPYEPLQYERPSLDEALQHSRDFLASMQRRSVRAFSADPVPFELIELYVVLPVGYPAPDCRVPVLRKKQLDEVMIVL